MKKVLVCAALIVCAAACRPKLSPAGKQVRQIASPQGCAFVGQVSGWVDYVGPSGQRDAKVRAMNDAAAMGANAVMWTAIGSGAIDSQAEGEAYRCP
jgi:hypothetical protein